MQIWLDGVVAIGVYSSGGLGVLLWLRFVSSSRIVLIMRSIL